MPRDALRGRRRRSTSRGSPRSHSGREATRGRGGSRRGNAPVTRGKPPQKSGAATGRKHAAHSTAPSTSAHGDAAVRSRDRTWTAPELRRATAATLELHGVEYEVGWYTLKSSKRLVSVAAAAEDAKLEEARRRHVLQLKRAAEEARKNKAQAKSSSSSSGSNNNTNRGSVRGSGGGGGGKAAQASSSNHRRLLIAKDCRFFTRTGRCARGNQCPFVHNPAKVAICQKVLAGGEAACRARNCPLAHEIVPEKMPVCTFFLRGTCSKSACPFIHVRHPESTPKCKVFSQFGYCEDGASCKFRHVLERPPPTTHASAATATADPPLRSPVQPPSPAGPLIIRPRLPRIGRRLE